MGVKRTSRLRCGMSANDSKRTFDALLDLFAAASCVLKNDTLGRTGLVTFPFLISIKLKIIGHQLFSPFPRKAGGHITISVPGCQNDEVALAILVGGHNARQ